MSVLEPLSLDEASAQLPLAFPISITHLEGLQHALESIGTGDASAENFDLSGVDPLILAQFSLAERLIDNQHISRFREAHDRLITKYLSYWPRDYYQTLLKNEQLTPQQLAHLEIYIADQFAERVAPALDPAAVDDELGYYRKRLKQLKLTGDEEGKDKVVGTTMQLSVSSIDKAIAIKRLAQTHPGTTDQELTALTDEGEIAIYQGQRMHMLLEISAAVMGEWFRAERVMSAQPARAGRPGTLAMMDFSSSVLQQYFPDLNIDKDLPNLTECFRDSTLATVSEGTDAETRLKMVIQAIKNTWDIWSRRQVPRVTKHQDRGQVYSKFAAHWLAQSHETMAEDVLFNCYCVARNALEQLSGQSPGSPASYILGASKRRIVQEAIVLTNIDWLDSTSDSMLRSLSVTGMLDGVLVTPRGEMLVIDYKSRLGDITPVQGFLLRLKAEQYIKRRALGIQNKDARKDKKDKNPKLKPQETPVFDRYYHLHIPVTQSIKVLEVAPSSTLVQWHDGSLDFASREIAISAQAGKLFSKYIGYLVQFTNQNKDAVKAALNLHKQTVKTPKYTTDLGQNIDYSSSPLKFLETSSMPLVSPNGLLTSLFRTSNNQPPEGAYRDVPLPYFAMPLEARPGARKKREKKNKRSS